ncbi:MAG: phenylalanine--tRNA ligase subunit beta [Bacteroidetes bacterium]|nr:phenylalanine--tRNA ligase subunit beta [Bacteroidota bacterium]MBU1371140.1 phenylalanine--tRNA ligase subunit beta [Bacteroidota bacterium]MBU1484693.1 phenylalanine--tRNA ligase subunit beta [Bacteroidota bacterium]MBU1759914.1 phenylalanine--tRNA ligase subunit beta [Bacteroidota bacterium]MBU2045669.1 phenylalanine--tRNA ligase subunit beta [Bacteroidota bacterium]
MKISYNWLKQFIDTDKTPNEVSSILTAIGLEVESLDKVQAIPGGLEGLVIGFVKDCGQHPNADRLKVTKVDVGGPDLLEIVCGAPNVAAGQKVVVATVGCDVHPTHGEPFKINKSKIRGEVSEGMICAEDEIGLGEGHEGIMILPDDAVIGTLAKDYFNLPDDYLFEIGLTPNRADAASHLGVARDLAAFLKAEIRIPAVEKFKVANTSNAIAVEVVDEDAAPRYSGVTISGITVQDSPQWLKEKLAVIGLRPINNIVDVTNYVLHDLGQPLHAFDADEITGGKVIVKKCAEGTKFKTLDEVERTLTADDLMICNNKEAMCIAGVFGGVKSGVKSSTKNIFLESAYFNSVSVRKTSKRFGLKTDASFRFERGTDPEITVYALKRAALLIQEVAGGEVTSEIFDHYPNPVSAFEVELTFDHVQKLIGKAIPKEEITEIIKALGIEILKETEDQLSLKVPTYKVDVTRPVDVIEEVLRIYGYDNIEIPQKVNASLNVSPKPDKEALQHTVADMLTANGYFEILSNSLTKSSYSSTIEEAVKILNPLSSDLDVMRQSMLYSGLEAVAYNQNRRYNDVKFYEFGKTYHLNNEKYEERNHLSIFISGKVDAEQWNQGGRNINFYNLKAVVDAILKRLNIQNLQSDEIVNPEFAYGVQYRRGAKVLVEFGAVANQTLKATDVNKTVFYADFNWDMILMLVKNNTISYKEVSKFPAVRRDLSMLIDQNVRFEDLRKIAIKTEKSLLKEVNVFDVYKGDKLPENKKSYALSFILQDEEKTLTEQQIDGIMKKLIANFGKEVGAEIR